MTDFSIHRSVAVHCANCRRETNVIVDGQCVGCHFGHHAPRPQARQQRKPKMGQH